MHLGLDAAGCDVVRGSTTKRCRSRGETRGKVPAVGWSAVGTKAGNRHQQSTVKSAMYSRKTPIPQRESANMLTHLHK